MSQQIAVNAAAVRNLADRLEALGYAGGDVYRVAESIAVNLLADGYRPVERPVAVVGSGSTPEARQAAREALRAALDARKRGDPTAQAGSNDELDSGAQM